jgi:hypothetical protein
MTGPELAKAGKGAYLTFVLQEGWLCLPSTN